MIHSWEDHWCEAEITVGQVQFPAALQSRLQSKRSIPHPRLHTGRNNFNGFGEITFLFARTNPLCSSHWSLACGLISPTYLLTPNFVTFGSGVLEFWYPSFCHFPSANLQYSTPFRNAKSTNESELADFAHITIGWHGNVPWAIGK